jgi:ribose/xylose/arabinose/galactoside ABC-type transport system permease subunit
LKKQKSVVGSFLRKNVILLLLVAMIVIFSIAMRAFLSVTNLMNIYNQNASLLLSSCGLAMIMISGGIDLSIGYIASLCGVVAAILMKNYGVNIYVAILAALVIGAACGALNGFLSNRLRIHTMIVTLATMTLFQGLSYIISGSKSYSSLPAAFKFLGQGYIGKVPVSIFLVALIIAAGSFFLNKTHFGRYMYAIGGNPDAAFLAGINVGSVRQRTFALNGAMVGMAAVLLISRSGSASSSMGTSLQFDSITACILGGVSFTGGAGKIGGVVLGVLCLGVLSNGMQLVGWGIYTQYVVKSILLVAAIAFDLYTKSKELADREGE